jgi:uncharacterized protein (TIGR02001 family)
MQVEMKKLRNLSLAVTTAVAGLCAPLAHADVTGNINVVSKYVLRGITNNAENDNTAVQGGFDYTHSSGFYAGYWGSNLDYTVPATSVTTGFENDLYAGYKGKAGPMTLGLGAIYYAYTGLQDSDATEVAFTAAAGNASLGVNYLTKDVTWGNQGDTYFNLGYTQALPSDFSLVGNLMYYLYKKDGKFLPETPDSESSAFRGVSVTLSHPVAKAAGTMGLTLVGGGVDRYGVSQKLMPVLSFGTTF